MFNSQEKSKISIRLPKLGQTRGQVSETMTWVVATVAIIVILILSIFIVQLGFKGKSFSNQRGTSDLLVTKSFMGYLLSDDGKGQVWGQVKDKKGYPLPIENDFGDGSIKLFKMIFPILYNEEYRDFFWMGILSKDLSFDPVTRSGKGIPVKSKLGDRVGESQGSINFYYTRIKLNQDSILELILVKQTI